MDHIPESRYLPPEVWTQILPILPAKTLLRFRCVCKSWYSIIDHPDFVSMHLQLCKINVTNNKLLLALEGLEGYERDRGCLLTVREAKTLRKTDHIFRKSDSYYYHIIGHCNGLFLVNRRDGCFSLSPEELRLWNPCIRRSLVLPICPLTQSPYLLKVSKYVFGFDPVSKDYKVVAIAFEKSAADEIMEKITGIGEITGTHVAVYTLSNQQWTVKNDCFNVSYPYRFHWRGPFYSLSTAVFYRGCAYWLGQLHTHRSDLIYLGSLDFDTQKITFLELPFTWDENALQYLFLLGGSLAILSISKVTSSIWVLQEDNKNVEPWTLWFSGKSNSNAYNEVSTFFYIKEKVFYCEGDGGYFVWGEKSYNISTCKVRESKRYLNPYTKLERYSESLVLLNGYGARDLRYFP